MSYQVVKEREGLWKGFPAAAALEGLLCGVVSLLLLLAAGARQEGHPGPRAPAQLSLAVRGLEPEVA